DIRALTLDIVELAALRKRDNDVHALAAERRTTLPEMGRAVIAGEQITLCVRPHRWLMIAPDLKFSEWQQACEGAAVAVYLSSGPTAFRRTEPAACAALARGCRLDLDPQVFQEGHAAATIIAQVSVILARLSVGLLLLTPATTARHFREWLGEQIR